MLPFFMSSSPHFTLPTPSPTASHHKVLRPIISPATPVESTLPRPLASVHSKPLAGTRFPLESTLTKKPGGRGQLLLTRHATKRVCPDEHRDGGPLFDPSDFSHQEHRDGGPLYGPTRDFFPERPSRRGDTALSSPLTAHYSLFTSSPTETNSALPAGYPRSPPTPETFRAAAPAPSLSRLSKC
jgi:hypothetical protein